MSKVAKKILDEIGKVKPRPKWYFVGKRVFIWSSLVVAILLSAFSVSMIIHQLFIVDWDVLPRVGAGPGPVPIPSYLKVLPYFWMVISALLFLFVYFDFKQTRKGYRYSGGVIVAGSVVVAVVLGVGSYFLRAPERADDFLRDVPGYKELHFDEGVIWMMPEAGLLSGEVVELDGPDIFILEDVSNEIWRVDKSHAAVKQGRDSREIMEGIRLKILGEMLAEGDFRADEIRFFRFR